MRFSYAEAMTDPAFYIPLAKAAEAAGYASMTIPDSIAYPFESDSKYPYTPDGSREFLDGKAFIETFVLTAALGAVTTTLRFNFFVLKLPIRPPALVAKQAGSLAALIGNRVGPRRGHQPVAGGLRADGCPIRQARQADGRVHRDRPGPDHRRLLRVPRRVLRHSQDEDDPGSDPADPDSGRRPRRCRAAARGAPGRLDARRRRSPKSSTGSSPGSSEFREEEGKTGPFEIHVISIDGFTVDGIKRLEDKGVTDVIVGFRVPYIMGPDTEPLDVKIRNLEKFAEKVIAKA